MTLEDATDAYFDFINTTMAGVPTALKSKLRDLARPKNPMGFVAAVGAELIYKHKDDLANVPALLTIAANLAEAADEANAFGIGVERRGRRIGSAIRKMAGVAPRPAEPTDDPEPLNDPADPLSSSRPPDAPVRAQAPRATRAPAPPKVKVGSPGPPKPDKAEVIPTVTPKPRIRRRVTKAS